ncbi:Lipoyltransferase and lipoate- ligase [Pyrrhoderma noxium]|uniref:Putative lipoate-protein ligase A n=1 Tax=Pyrrhoderma noxium TaxID=2282107 RepID=A0A286UP10_9AGAM|nr:Lipoyltransferase and lipoate- ligase [Pyrrhoderma noxium]
MQKDPYFNLSLEDWLFRRKDPQKPLLLLYRNEPCVVIGRNQNPWKEVNLQLARSKDIPVIRRRSGGGTVYHDLGNTNYSVHVPRSAFDRNDTSKIVIQAVRSLGVDADVNDRNDVCAGVRLIKFLFSTFQVQLTKSLNTLGDLLHTTKETMVTKGVASVRSPVQNLRHFDPSITHELFVEATITAFREHFSISEEACCVEEVDCSQITEIYHGMDELKSWDWLFGQTPEFTYTVSHLFDWGEVKAEIKSKHGFVTGCNLEGQGVDQNIKEHLETKMIGLKYGDLGKPEDSILRAVDGIYSIQAQGIWSWLQSETSI